MNFKELNSFLSDSQILRDQKSLEYYGQDWLKLFNANPSLVVFPKTTKDVVQLVHWARKNKVPLVPSGGRTGLSGSATAVNGEIIVSFEKMNRMIDFNEFEETLTVQPGMITKSVQQLAQERGFFMPISFSAEGSSHIGGNVATNAGGIHVIRYGLMRNWVKGIQVVTGKGEVLNLGRRLVKDATGYNLMHLFIGSEGTLGFITEVSLALTRKPNSLNVFLLAVPHLTDIIEIYSCFKKEISLHAFEVFTHQALEYVEKNHPSPLSKKSPYYILMEILEEEQAKALNVFEKLMNDGKIDDGTMSQNEKQARQIWALRENISESIAVYQPYKNDISVRISKLPKFLAQVHSLLKERYPHYKVLWFGHIGDGNMHINILKDDQTTKKDFIKNCKDVNQLLFSKVKEFEGSISAEHGVGLLKKDDLHFSRSKEEIEYMRAIKNIFDPDHIINPGKIID